MMRISTIIPAYNRAALIGETLRSILAQTRPPHEIIVVDDGSSDATAAAVEEFGPAITLLRQDNAGPGAARNAGLARATGDIIHFMDSDDLSSPNSYAVQAAAIEAGADMTYGPWMPVRLDDRVAYPDSVVVQQQRIPARPAMDKQVMTGTWLTVFQPCMFRRSLIDKAGPYRTDIRTGEDIEMLYRIAQYSPKITHTPTTIVLYRVHPEGQVSQQNLRARALDQAHLWSIFQKHAEERADLDWRTGLLLRNRKLMAAAEVRGYSPELAQMLEADCSVPDRLFRMGHALATRVMAKVRAVTVGHRHRPAFRAGSLNNVQREQIALMGFSVNG